MQILNSWGALKLSGNYACASFEPLRGCKFSDSLAQSLEIFSGYDPDEKCAAYKLHYCFFFYVVTKQTGSLHLKLGSSCCSSYLFRTKMAAAI